MSKAYVIGNITITNADGYAQYSARVPAVAGLARQQAKLPRWRESASLLQEAPS